MDAALLLGHARAVHEKDRRHYTRSQSLHRLFNHLSVFYYGRFKSA